MSMPLIWISSILTWIRCLCMEASRPSCARAPSRSAASAPASAGSAGGPRSHASRTHESLRRDAPPPRPPNTAAPRASCGGIRAQPWPYSSPSAPPSPRPCGGWCRSCSARWPWPAGTSAAAPRRARTRAASAAPPHGPCERAPEVRSDTTRPRAELPRAVQQTCPGSHLSASSFRRLLLLPAELLPPLTQLLLVLLQRLLAALLRTHALLLVQLRELPALLALLLLPHAVAGLQETRRRLQCRAQTHEHSRA